MKRYTIISLIICICVIGCSDEKKDQSTILNEQRQEQGDCNFSQFEKNKALTAYLNRKELNHLTVEKGDTILFLPLGSCHPCITRTLDAAITNLFSSKLIVGGREIDFPEHQEMLNELKQNARYVNDINNLMYEYDIDIVGPAIFINTENHGYVAFHLDFENWPCIAEKMNWKLSTIKISEP